LTRVPDHELEEHLDRWAHQEGIQGVDALNAVVPGSRRIAWMEREENP